MASRARHTPANALGAGDLARPPAEVAAGLAAWARGDRDEAVALCLEACAREVHARSYTLWVWTSENAAGDAVWLLPVRADHARAFAPRWPMAALTRAFEAAWDAGAVLEGLCLLDWRGMVALEAPEAEHDHELVQMALADHQPHGVTVAVTPLDPRDLGTAAAIDLPPVPPGGDGLAGLAGRVGTHPVDVALALAAHGQPLDRVGTGDDMVHTLAAWGLAAAPAPPEPDAPASMDPAHDPCPHRRHARILLRRLLRMGKVGSGYHTADDHLYRGAPPDFRHEATEVGEALIRAGLLGSKPSVGQRHVYLRREALPAIHGLIDRAETDSPVLDALWTRPPPRRPGG
ncbi:MAG: hypothetical protein KDC33_09295 [Thermoleophilia bacterium]|nr:hypothetical protein [Thermoleophilia bacterium]